MRELLPSIDRWTQAGQAITRGVVIRTFGSSPRREGATMIRSDVGAIVGSVSGGCVEGATAEHMEQAGESGMQRVVRFGVSDEEAWDVGLACGGTIDVLVQPAIPAAALVALRETAHDRTAGRAVVTRLPTGSPDTSITGSRLGPPATPEVPLIAYEDGRLDGSLGDASADAALLAEARAAISSGTSCVVEIGEGQLFIEAFPVRPRLVVVGAGEVGVALLRMAGDLGYETVVIDARAAFVTPERFPGVDRLFVGWPDDAAVEIDLGRGDAVAVLSHDPKFDEPAIEVALQRGCRYVGVIGSRKTQRDRFHRLRERGLDDAQLARLHGPIGLDLGGREPAETAVAIMAEIIAARYGGTGRPMRDVVAERRDA